MCEIAEHLHNTYTYEKTLPLREVNSLTKNFPCFLWNLPVNYRSYKEQPLIPILSQMDPLHDVPRFNIISQILVGFPSGLFPSGCPVKTLLTVKAFPVVKRARK